MVSVQEISPIRGHHKMYTILHPLISPIAPTATQSIFLHSPCSYHFAQQLHPNQLIPYTVTSPAMAYSAASLNYVTNCNSRFCDQRHNYGSKFIYASSVTNSLSRGGNLKPCNNAHSRTQRITSFT